MATERITDFGRTLDNFNSIYSDLSSQGMFCIAAVPGQSDMFWLDEGENQVVLSIPESTQLNTLSSPGLFKENSCDNQNLIA